MASWDTPAVAAPTTANYAAPLVDFPKVANQLEDLVVKRQQAGREEEKANVFRNGIPKDANGNIDVGQVTDKLARINPDYAMPLINTQIAGQQGQVAANAINGVNGTPAAPASTQPPQRAASASSPQPASTPAAATQPTVMTILDAQGIPNDQLQAASESLARQLGVSPTDPIDTSDPRVRNVLGPAIQRLKGVGQVVAQSGQPQAATPQSTQPDAQPQPDSGAQPQQGGTTGWTQADADAQSLRSTRLNAYAAAIANVNPKAAEAAKAEAAAAEGRAKQIRDYISSEDTSTNDQKNYQSDKLPGESMADYQARAAGGQELAKQDSIAYSKKYEGIQKAAQEASIEQPKIQLMKTFSNDPNFYSGPLEPTNRGFKQFAATIGADPNRALPQEGFNKVASDMLTSQIRALGASGAGPVRIAEVKNMQKSIANLGITPVTNRLLVEITDRAYNDVKNIAELTRKYETNPKNLPGKKNVGLDTEIQKYYDSHPLFTKEEISDPRLIAPPEFKDSRLAFNAKLPKGQPVKIDGKLKWVQ